MTNAAGKSAVDQFMATRRPTVDQAQDALLEMAAQFRHFKYSLDDRAMYRMTGKELRQIASTIEVAADCIAQMVEQSYL